jgi:hypothetical protein
MTRRASSSVMVSMLPPLATVAPRPVPFAHLGLGELQGGGVTGEVHVLVDGDERRFLSQE